MVTHADDNSEARSPGTPVQSSSEEQKPSSNDKVVKLHTDEDVEKITADKHSKLRREIAGLQKQVAAIPTLQSQLVEARGTLTEAVRENERKEFDAAKEAGTDSLKLWERKKEVSDREGKVKEAEAILKRDQEEHSSLFEAANKVSLLSQAQEIGQKYGIPPELLTDWDTPEKMEAHAEKLKGHIGKPTPTMEPDTGGGTGVTGEPTKEQRLKKRYPSM